MMLRAADSGDMEWLYQTRNDPWIVSFGTNRTPFSWDEHQRWFEGAQDRHRHLLFLIESDETPPQRIGTVRLDRLDRHTAKVSAYLIKEFVGRGIGPIAIDEACRTGFREWPALRTIEAHIRGDNVRSIRAFARAGFARREGGDTGYVMVRGRPEEQTA
jgi:RimJ/RimL family protein N-acetyltransferase